MLTILLTVGATVVAGVTFVATLWAPVFGSKTVPQVLGSLTNRKSRAIPSPAGSDVSIKRYLAEVARTHTMLRFGDPTSSLQQTNAPDRLKLSDVYTPLSVGTEFVGQGGNTEPVTNQPARQHTLATDAVKQPEAHRVIVLGAPGAGKSTLIDVLAYALSVDRRCPVHVRLGDLDVARSTDWWHAVSEIETLATNTDLDRGELIASLHRKLVDGDAALYLDGLDEVSEEQTSQVIALVERLSVEFPKSQIIITCRSADFEQRNISLHLKYTRLRLMPFSVSDMIDYVDKWYNQLQKLQHVSDAQARKRNLQDALRNSVELSQLASTPLILNLMALVHMSDGELARSRAILYHRTVSHLLSDKPHWRRAYGSVTISQSELQPLAAHVAYQIHLKEVDNPARRHGLSFEEIEEIVAAKMGVQQAGNTTAYKRSRERIGSVVQRLVDSNGLMVMVSRGRFGFSHRSLQEFLTGLHILDLADVDLIRGFAGRAHWREPLILMAGYGGREGSATFFIATVIDALVNDAMADTHDGVRVAILTGEMLAEIGATTLRARSQGWVLDGRPDQSGPSTWDHVADLIRDASGRAELGERIELLRVLGRLGDPRIVQRDGNLVPVFDRMAYLPPTALDVGDDDPARPKPKSDLVETVPKRRLTFGAMHVPKYMVTNAEYERFIDDEGYEDRSLWREEGLRWLAEDPSFRDELEQKTKEWVVRDFGPELELGRYRLDDILSDAREMSRARLEPFYWRNQRYNQPTQPVVGVNMWEAMAYCAWLQRRLQREGVAAEQVEIRLPTEWEWERAARGAGRNAIFPWGSEQLTAKRAHTRAANLALDHAAPVGAFPDGQTDYNLFDIAGNAWEWTCSRAVPPSPEHDVNRNDVAGIVDVVVRGGSFFSDEPQSVRCGYRGIDLPQNVYFDVGFRPFIFNHRQEERSGAPRSESTGRTRGSGRYQP
ncbi:hypothetical protein DMC25_23235 [Caulobacter sp. D4A]|uniref:NACHT domain-containing protein n=1 Tax=unclassified Caulobacter TaxID=2648921 RepID=UPI000D738A8C|nr:MULTISPECIES: SUMF1/EgtB/PvdO family nonheme iron enzyme [unclassified Caulobacter]PXA77593.1 hypothetical protein DMC25_23235 [Caulobacter sp. D4A]PXA96140.1 hypothetical protein DMC18_02095 [Caulobacter sp. D5]